MRLPLAFFLPWLAFFTGALLAPTFVASARAEPAALPAPAPTYATASDLAYHTQAPDGYAAERCKLDVYHPVGVSGYSTVVWFHGGGLTDGAKEVPGHLRNAGIAVVAVNYRLTPRAATSDCLADAAAAIAWTLEHIERYGGDPRRVFLSGHSAGAYLALMVAMDPRWLAPYHRSSADVAGVFALSGQTLTHMAARRARGIGAKQPVVDELAPLFHVRGDLPPILLVTGDRELELNGRYEENAVLWRMLKLNGQSRVILHELDGFDHGGMLDPAQLLLLRYLREWTAPTAGVSSR